MSVKPPDAKAQELQPESQFNGAESPPDTPGHFEEGGPQGWLMVLGSFCLFLSIFGPINTAAVFESYLSEHQLVHQSPSQIAWIFSLYLFVLYFVGVQVGPVFDRYGHRVLVAVGTFLMVLGMMLFSMATKYYQFILSFSILTGIGGALLNTPAYAAIGHFFVARRGFATGIAATAGSIGGIVFPLVLQATLPRLGFGWGIRIIGFVLLFLAIPSNLLMRSRVRPEERPTSVWFDPRLFRIAPFTLCCSGIFFMEYGVLIPLTYITSYAISHGIDTRTSYVLPALLNAGSVLGRAIPGLVGDYIGRFNVLIMTVGMCTATVLALWLPAQGSKALLITFSLLVGFASGGNVSLMPVCIGQLCEAKHYGRFLSTAMLVGSLGTLTGIPIGGALLHIGDEETGWRALILFSGLSYTVSLASYVFARIIAVGYSLQIKY